VAGLPLAPFMMLDQAQVRQLALPTFIIYVAVVAATARWLWPQLPRFDGVILILPALFALVIAGGFSLWVAISSLCSSGDNNASYLSSSGRVLALIALAAPYLLVSSWAVAKPSRTPWAWPLAIVLAFACGLAVLALVEGGTHYCST
jgi:hypothetical protein